MTILNQSSFSTFEFQFDYREAQGSHLLSCALRLCFEAKKYLHLT